MRRPTSQSASQDPVAIVARLDDQAKVAGHRLPFILFEKRAGFDGFREVPVFRSGFERQRVVHRIDDLGGIFILEEFHAEDLEGLCLA